MYTPGRLAAFIAARLFAHHAAHHAQDTGWSLLDPAVGDGALVAAALDAAAQRGVDVDGVTGVDIDAAALDAAAQRVGRGAWVEADFLEWAFAQERSKADLIIANPPYVRTQTMGREASQHLADRFGLTGRVDLSHAFLLAIWHMLADGGTAAIITSNRFMTTRAGEVPRRVLRQQARLCEVWDLGDTRLFDAAVLPVLLILRRPRADDTDGAQHAVPCTSIYALEDADCEDATQSASHILDALPMDAEHAQVCVTEESSEATARVFSVRHGTLEDDGAPGNVWRVLTGEDRRWLRQIEEGTWATFGELGPIKVGVKSCADRVFIREDWASVLDCALDEVTCLKLLRTHHTGQRWCPQPTSKRILYPHRPAAKATRGEAVPLEELAPEVRVYLENHRQRLEGRGYLIDAGRHWHELWVPQDPAVWATDKLVWRDIVDEPTFWLDTHGCVVNGDCYWMAVGDDHPKELIWLALAVANAPMIGRFYDLSFHNKLYSGRRRFITQYVRHFPLPDPAHPDARAMMDLARQWADAPEDEDLAALDALAQRAFGVEPGGS